MRSLALFLPNWIGDVVMATPAIRSIRECFPNTRILAVGSPYVRDVMSGSPRIDRFLEFLKPKPLDLLREFHQERVDTALSFSNSFRVAAIARLAGCQRLVGFCRYFRDFLLTDRVYYLRDNYGRFRPVPVLDDYNRLAVSLGVRSTSRQMELFSTTFDESSAEAVWKTLGLSRFRTLIGLNPGGAFGSSKHWPKEYFSKLARSIVQEFNAGVVVLSGPAEREESRRIAGLANHPNVISLADQSLSIGLTKSAIRRLTALVTTDSGPRHFATAFGVPAITLFGPTHIGWTETYSGRDRNLQLTLPCGPCQKRVCPFGHHRCMTDLKPHHVISVLSPILAGALRHAG